MVFIIRRKGILLIIATIFSLGLVAQSREKISFFLTPYIGFEYLMSRFDVKSNLPPYVNKTPHLNLVDKYGIGLQIYFENKISLELGYGWDNIGYGIKGKSRSMQIKDQLNFSSSPSFTVRNSFLTIHKILKRIDIVKRK